MNKKIEVEITWVADQSGKIEPEITASMDDYLEFDGSIGNEID